MPKQRITSDDLVRKIRETVSGGQVERRSLTKPTTAGGGQGGQPFVNPLTTIGDLIRGGTSGALQRLGIGTEGQVLTVTDVAGDLIPQWQDNAGGGGGGGRYRALVYELDGSGSFDFLVDEDGHPIYELTELEA